MSTQHDITATIAELRVVVKHLGDSVKALGDKLDSRSGLNWSAIGVAVGVAIPTIGGLTYGFITRLSANELSVARVEERLERRLELEQERNNKLEREMGAAERTDQLFMAGRLNLGGHPQ